MQKTYYDERNAKQFVFLSPEAADIFSEVTMQQGGPTSSFWTQYLHPYPHLSGKRGMKHSKKETLEHNNIDKINCLLQKFISTLFLIVE